MEPMLAATSFATIVSLLADFVAHRGANDGKSYDEFMAWLAEQRHEEIRSLLQSNSTTSIGIKALLGENQREILQRLQALDRSLASFAAGFEAYRGIAEAAHPESALSSQALSLLEQFYDSGASKVLESVGFSGTGLHVVDGPRNGSLEFTDARFLSDDLKTLVQLNLLDVERNGSGQRLFVFTRAAARLVESRRGA